MLNAWFSDHDTPGPHPPKTGNGPSSHPLPRTDMATTIPLLSEVPHGSKLERRLSLLPPGTSAGILLSSRSRCKSYQLSPSFSRGRIRELFINMECFPAKQII